MNDAPRLKVVEVERYERDVRLRLPFRFGVIDRDACDASGDPRHDRAAGRAQRAGRRGRDAGGEMVRQEPRAVATRRTSTSCGSRSRSRSSSTRARGVDTPFGLYAGIYREQQARGAALDLNPLVASYGPALLDRAIADALGRSVGRSFPEMVSQNVLGIRATELTPDLAGFDIGAFLAGLRMAPSIEVRHTVGLVDPITAGDQKPGERVDDGLPETLEEVVRHYRGRYYKLKVGGNVAADLDRLARIAARARPRAAGEYRATLDGNEQYESVEGIAELWRRMRETPALRRLVDATSSSSSRSSAQVALSTPGRGAGAEEAAR